MLLWDWLTRALRAAAVLAALCLALGGAIYGVVLALRAVLGP